MRDDGDRSDHPLRLAPREFVMPVLMLGVIVATLFDPKVRATMAAAFGAQPFGLPVTAVVAVAMAALLLPLLWPLACFQRLVRNLLLDAGLGSASLQAARRALPAAARAAQTRRCLRWGAFGLAYFFLLVGAWIAYAAHRGV